MDGDETIAYDDACNDVTCICSNRFVKCKFEDGTYRESFGQEEKIGNKHLIFYYRSSEGMNERLDRLERSIEELKARNNDLIERLDRADERLDRTDEYIICGEIAYFIDKLASTAVYGFRVAESRHISIGQLMSPWRALTHEENARLVAFWQLWSPRLTPFEIKRRTDILRTARFPHAHQDEESKGIDRQTFARFIEKRFDARDAEALLELLDCLVERFSSPATPLVVRF